MRGFKKVPTAYTIEKKRLEKLEREERTRAKELKLAEHAEKVRKIKEGTHKPKKTIRTTLKDGTV